MLKKYFSVAEVAETVGVPPNKVLVWISSGELSATDVSNSRKERPRWRIGHDDLAIFLESRRSVAKKAAPKAKRSRRMDGIPQAIK